MWKLSKSPFIVQVRKKIIIICMRIRSIQVQDRSLYSCAQCSYLNNPERRQRLVTTYKSRRVIARNVYSIATTSNFKIISVWFRSTYINKNKNQTHTHTRTYTIANHNSRLRAV